MDTVSFLLVFVMSLGAAFVQRVSGFGFGIFIMTVLPHLLPTYGEATTLSGMLSIVVALPLLRYILRHVDWHKLLPILITFLAVSWIAVQIVSVVGDGLMKRILGVVLIIAGAWFYFFQDKARVRPTIPIQMSMGTLSGFMGGLFGMQGPPAVLYFLATAKDRDEYMALSQCYFLIGNIMMTFYRVQGGHFTHIVAISWCCGVGAVLLGAWLGGMVFRRLSGDSLRKVIYLYLVVSGVVALVL